MKIVEWTVIGAGPAGIAAVGKLIDRGVKPIDIAWVDPAFKVGDLGEKWRRVSSNTKVKLFLKYLEGCASFSFETSPDFEIKGMDGESTCLLGSVADPLQWICDHLKHSVYSIKGRLESLRLKNRRWELSIRNETLYSNNVILAHGAIPKKLDYPNLETIPLETAMDDQKLLGVEEDSVAVFGSSHSAIIVLQNLLRVKAKKVINFYQSPIKYAVFFDDWILFDNTGLKGKAAAWARENINGVWPKNFKRCQISDPHFKRVLASCNKVVYAVGFERRSSIDIPEMDGIDYNDRNGIIAPGLFGLGIAFPEKVEDRFGSKEYHVGLWKFMNYLNKVLPLWMKYAP